MHLHRNLARLRRHLNTTKPRHNQVVLTIEGGLLLYRTDDLSGGKTRNPGLQLNQDFISNVHLVNVTHELCEPISHLYTPRKIKEMAEELDALHVINALTQTTRVFYSNVRYLDSATRNNVVTLHERNMQLALNTVRSYMNPPAPAPRPRQMVFNIPLDAAAGFLDPVPIYPSPTQISNAVETRIPVTNTICTICQEAVTTATRIRHCGHCFHGNCIAPWFLMSARCPVCRYDIREFTQTPAQTTNDSGVHTDQE